MMRDHARPYDRELEVNRLLFAASFCGGIETAAIAHSIGDGLHVADRHRLRRMVRHAAGLRRAYEGLSDHAREQLGESRYARRAAFARGVLERV